MPKDAYSFKHNASDDLKCKSLRRKFGWQGQARYWKIIEIMRSEEEHRLAYSDSCFESLAGEFGVETPKAQEFLDVCIETHLFKKVDGFLFSERLNRDMAALEEKQERSHKVGLVKQRFPVVVKHTLPVIDNDFAAMVKLYEEKTGQTMAPPDVDLLKDIADHYPPDQFKKAVDEAVKNNARAPMKYIAKILENWKREKEVKTPARRSYDDGDRMDGYKEAES